MLKSYVNRLNKSLNYTISSPTGGLNLRDAFDSMAANEALQMDNYIPYDTKVVLRKGYREYARTDSKFQTLIAYLHEQSPRFIGISEGKAYNLTSAGNIKTYDDVNFSLDRCQTVQYKNYLYFMNGRDKPRVFYIDENGEEHFSPWQFYSENLEDEAIIAGGVSKQFLWFIENGSQKVWYAAQAGNISGELNCFDLSTITRFGGHLQAVCSWTVDGGQGIDDLTVFITSEGEVLVYSGSNPNSADDWRLKGSYKISAPLGWQCAMPYQGDLVIITHDGYMPLSKVLPLNEAGTSTQAFSDKISSLVAKRTAYGQNKDGWQGIIYPKGGYALFNVPISQGYEQHVVNLTTGAWCRFTAIKSHCWALFAGKLYFACDYGVCLFDSGYSDNGAHITGIVRQAYNDLGSNALKKIQLLNPRILSSTAFSLVIYTDMDFIESKQGNITNLGSRGVTRWNLAKWSSVINQQQTKWQTTKGTISSRWIANSAFGNKASIVFKTQTRGNLIEWYDTGVRYEQASGIM